MPKLLRQYSPEEAESHERLLESSSEALPSPLSKPLASYLRACESGNFSAAMNYCLDFFEIGIQFVSAALLVMIQDAEAANAQANAPSVPGNARLGEPQTASQTELQTEPQTSSHSTKTPSSLKPIADKIDTKRSLSFGDWMGDIFGPLVKTASKLLPESPLVQSISKEIFHKGANRLLGTRTEPGVVRIRNEYKGHSTTLSNDIYRGVCYTLEPHVLTLLRALAPLQDSSLEFTPEGQPILTQKTQPATQAQPATHKLYPLVFRSHEGYIYVFQSLKDEEISYVSADEQAVTLITDSLNPAFDALLQRSVPSFDIAREANWGELREAMCAESRRFLARLYADKKYNRELFLQRKALSSLLGDFKVSSKNLFPLLGEAGQGKTNQLARWTEEIMAGPDAVLSFSSSDFASQSLPDALRRIFGTSPRKDPAKILSLLDSRAATEGKKVFIIFDAINECLSYAGRSGPSLGPVSLYEDFVSLFIRPGYSSFKLLFTCRSYSWKTLFAEQSKRDATCYYGLEDGTGAEVHGFTPEELRYAWSIYQQLYQMEGSYDSLSGAAHVRLKDPLVLKIACTNHVGTLLPEATADYSSLALFGDMLRQVSRSYAGRRQEEILLEMAGYILDSYLSGTPCDRIDCAAIKAAADSPGSPLHKLSTLIYSEEGSVSVAYTELLAKPERPILRRVESSDGRSELQFIYERFLEYLLGLVFVRKQSSQATLIPPEEYVGALTKEQSGSVVFVGAMRNALILNSIEAGSDSAIISLMSEYAGNYEVSLLVSEVLNTLIRENHESLLFGLMEHIIDRPLEGKAETISRFNALTRLIHSNKADEAVVAEHRKLRASLSDVLNLASRASASICSGMFLSDWFNSSLYTRDPYELLWKLVRSPLLDVGNDACTHIYYLHNKTRTLEYSPIEENVADRIVRRMFEAVRSKRLLSTVGNAQLRSQAVSFVETGARLAVMLIFDEMLYGEGPSSPRVGAIMKEIRSILSYLTWDFKLIKAVMPFFSMILRRQITFQAEYVNNAIEYRNFWDDDIVPLEESSEDKWSRRSAARLAAYFTKSKEDLSGLRGEQKRILAAYRSGDSFSYFVLERLLAVAGSANWENIAPVVREFFTDGYRSTEWFDYSQMSMLYVLYQVQKKSAAYIPELMEIYSREAADWTLRCRGLFKARSSAVANSKGLYKRDVMNWYCDVYCTHTGDNVPHEGDSESVPVMRGLLRDSIAQGDAPLLCHLLDNVSELVSDNGYIHTALSLLLLCMELLHDAEAVSRIDAAMPEGSSVVGLIGRVLATCKNYFPDQTDAFLKRELSGLSFPGVAKYREEVLSYTPGGETLSDLFTHSFGNFVIWSLVNFDPFKSFAFRVIAMTPDSKDCFDWYDKVIREGFRTMFNVKL